MALSYELINGGTAYQITAPSCDVENDVKNLTIPDTYNNLPVIGIGGDGFIGCNYLQTLTLGDNIRFIGVSAFEVCENLRTVIIGKNLITLNNSAFNSATSLNAVYFKGNAPTFGTTIFDGTPSNLKLYRKKNFVTGWPSSVEGKSVVLWSDNVIKSGGTGKLTTKKRN